MQTSRGEAAILKDRLDANVEWRVATACGGAICISLSKSLGFPKSQHIERCFRRCQISQRNAAITVAHCLTIRSSVNGFSLFNGSKSLPSPASHSSVQIQFPKNMKKG